MFHWICRAGAAGVARRCATGGLWRRLLHYRLDADRHIDRCVDRHGPNGLDGRFAYWVYHHTRSDYGESRESQNVHLDCAKLNHCGATAGERSGAASIHGVGKYALGDGSGELAGGVGVGSTASPDPDLHGEGVYSRERRCVQWEHQAVAGDLYGRARGDARRLVDRVARTLLIDQTIIGD
jgi:hypothetical protein